MRPTRIDRNAQNGRVHQFRDEDVWYRVALVECRAERGRAARYSLSDRRQGPRGAPPTRPATPFRAVTSTAGKASLAGHALQDVVENRRDDLSQRVGDIAVRGVDCVSRAKLGGQFQPGHRSGRRRRSWWLRRIAAITAARPTDRAEQGDGLARVHPQ